MNQQFPTFHFEDKVNLESRDIVGPSIIHTYKRRGRKVISQQINDEEMIGEKIVIGGATSRRERVL